MPSVADMLKRMRTKHDDLNDRLAKIPESRMGDIGPWGQRQMPIRTMIYQLMYHEVEHTVHAVKTLRDLGIATTEVQLILGRLQEARGQLEGLLIGLSDEDLDRAPNGPWSLRQVLEHFMEIEDSSLPRIEQALSGA
ncbi:MAG: DinB family protein [Dehalococcoidia bacterium]|nr:DinB family protein [Dehalococcoidia bacterium]